MEEKFRIEYDFLTQNVPDQVFRWVEYWAGIKPGAAAFKGPDGKEFSFSDFLQLSRQQSVSLSRAGIIPGDRVAVLAGNSVEQIALIAACSMLKCTLVPLNWRLQRSELEYNMKDCSPKLLVHDRDFESRALEIKGKAENRYLESLHESGFCDFQPEVKAETSASEYPLMILYTSGTTGFPKGAMISERQIWQNSINTLTNWGLSVDERYLLTAPLFHTGGWNVLTLPILMAGGTTTVMKGFDADAALLAIHEDNISVYFGVPTMFQMLTESSFFKPENLHSLKLLISGGAPCPPSLIEKFHSAGIGFRQGYGLTEVGPNCFSIAEEDVLKKPGSVGFPMTASRIRILDDAGNEVEPGGNGELAISGEHVCMGYYGKPEETEKANPDGYFRTGDFVRMDEEGFFYIVGRKKEMFISGGENVYPQEIENRLSFLDEIKEAAVVGIPDPKWGEVGLAAVSLSNGCFPGTEEEQEEISRRLKEKLKSEIASYKVPKKFVFYRELPKNHVGKIDKNLIKNSYIRKV